MCLSLVSCSTHFNATFGSRIAVQPQQTPPPSAPAQVKLRLRAIFQRLPRPAELPRDATVALTFTNGHYSELMLNSLATLAALGLPAFVYCFDAAAVALCEDLGIPHFQPLDAARIMESADFRQDRAKFLQMGVHKPEMVERLFSGMCLHPGSGFAYCAVSVGHLA